MFLGCCRAQSEQGEWKDIYGDPVRPRRTGYELPPDALQLGAWCAILVLTVLHYTVQIPFFDGALFIVVLVISSVLIASVFVTKVALELYPQQDPVVFQADLPRLDQDQLLSELAPPGTEPCVFCRRFVQVGCKHCSVCDKCVPGFDHHCRWLNSCVGAKNYRLFATFMGVAWVGMAWVAAFSLYTIQLMLRDISAFKAYMRTHVYHSPSRAFPALVVFNFVCLFIAGAGICALGKLIYFHLYLYATHQSTYEHIVKRREKKRALGEYHRQNGEPPHHKGLLGCLEMRKRRDFKKHGTGAAAGEGENGEGEAHSAGDDRNACEMRYGDGDAHALAGGSGSVGAGADAAAPTASTTPRHRRCSTGLVANSGSDPGRKNAEEEEADFSQRAVPSPSGRRQRYTPVPEAEAQQSAERYHSVSFSSDTHEPVEAAARR